MVDTLQEVVGRIKVVDPEKIILFGSRSKGTSHEESDYDLLVLKSNITNRRKLARIIYRKLIGVDASVDIIVESPERLERLKENPYLIYQEMLKTGKIIYEKE